MCVKNLEVDQIARYKLIVFLLTEEFRKLIIPSFTATIVGHLHIWKHGIHKHPSRSWNMVRDLLHEDKPIQLQKQDGRRGQQMEWCAAYMIRRPFSF